MYCTYQHDLSMSMNILHNIELYIIIYIYLHLIMLHIMNAVDIIHDYLIWPAVLPVAELSLSLSSHPSNLERLKMCSLNFRFVCSTATKTSGGNHKQRKYLSKLKSKS